MFLSVQPAYGRDYKSQKEVRAAWAAGKDFQINDMSSPDDGRYVNRDDLPAGVKLQVRFGRQLKTMILP